jgi:hypothetical protein
MNRPSYKVTELLGDGIGAELGIGNHLRDLRMAHQRAQLLERSDPGVELAGRAEGLAAGQRGENDGVSPTSMFNAQKEAANKASDLRIKAANAFAEWKEKTPSGRGMTNEMSGPLWDKYDAIRREYRYWRDRAGRPGGAAASATSGKSKTKDWKDL